MSAKTETILGHFVRAEAARHAYAELRAGQGSRPDVQIVVRTPGKQHEDLPLSMTDARGAIARGVFLGALLGFVTCAVVVAIGSRMLGFDTSAAWLGAIGGTILGAFAGALVGAGNPHPVILAAEREGGVTLAVEAPQRSDRDWASRVMRRHDGRVEPMPVASARVSLAT
jgi:hypothetical protein